MSTNKLEYYHVAEIQIETAIDLFNEGNFICAITLAGAGEEILGTLLQLLYPSAEKAMDKMTQGVSAIAPELSHKEIRDDSLNIVRNGFKHVKEDICEQDIDLRLHAIQYIARACVNYVTLRDTLTVKMIAFSNAHPGSYFDEVTEGVKS